MMHFKKLLLPLAASIAVFGSCESGNSEGKHTPIDSTNMHGTAPATYEADNPANYQDTTLENSTDTGTRSSNGPDNAVHRKEDRNSTPRR